MKEKIEKLFANEEVVAKMLEAGDPSEMRKTMADNGVELTDEEFVEFLAVTKEVTKDGELSENDLDSVAGGFLSLGAAAIKGTWDWACSYWGGPKEATRQTVTFWAKALRIVK